MSPLGQLVLGWQCLIYTLRQLLNLKLWVPWLLAAAFQIAWLSFLVAFAHPVLSWFMVPLLSALAGERVLHYPDIFEALPSLFARGDLVLSVSTGALAAGASTALFAARFAGAEPIVGVGLRAALRRAVALLLANLPLTVLVIGLSAGLDAFGTVRGSSGIVRRLLRLIALAGTIGLQAFFLYVNALVMCEGLGVLAAFKRLPAAAARAGWAALMMAGIGLCALLPFQTLGGAAGAIVARGRPELTAAVVIAQILATMLVSFLLTGTATLLYQSAIAPREDD